jgi:hypothetical protein
MLLERFRDSFHVVLLSCAQLNTRRALLQHVLHELSLPYRGMDEGELRLSLIDFLDPQQSGAEGVLLIVDEAHTLPLRLFEDIRMITNFARDGQPRVRLILCGGPLLEERFAHPDLECFNQRLAARCYLQPLNYDETCAYVRAQISKVGGDPDCVFTADAWQAVYHASDGIPRLINQICDHALMLACVGQRMSIDAGLIQESWADLQQLPTPWQASVQEAPASEAVIEFGSLDETDAGDSQVEGSTDAVVQSPSDLPADTLEDVARDAVTNDPEDVESVDHEDPVAEPEITGSSGEVLNPFDESFDQEEVVVDRYVALQRDQQGSSVAHQQREIVSAMQTIFDPVPATDTNPQQEIDLEEVETVLSPNSDPSPVPLEVSGIDSEPVGEIKERVSDVEGTLDEELAEEAEEMDCVPDPAETLAIHLGPEPSDDVEERVLEALNELGLDPLGAEEDNERSVIALQQSEQETARVEVIRTPPDDSDMIVVIDGQQGETPLRPGGGIKQKQEYRQLFSQLRKT